MRLLNCLSHSQSRQSFRSKSRRFKSGIGTGRPLDQQGAIPAILLNFDEVLRKRDGGANTEFAALGETEEYLPIALDVVLKESVEFPKPLTDQVSDAMYTVERIVNGTPRFGH